MRRGMMTKGIGGRKRGDGKKVVSGGKKGE